MKGGVLCPPPDWDGLKQQIRLGRLRVVLRDGRSLFLPAERSFSMDVRKQID